MGTSLRSLMPRNQKALYEQNPSVGCYVYYLQYVNKAYWEDVTPATNHLWRRINHSKCGNCQTKLEITWHQGHVFLIAITSWDFQHGRSFYMTMATSARPPSKPTLCWSLNHNVFLLPFLPQRTRCPQREMIFLHTYFSN